MSDQRQTTDALHLLLHQMAWGAWEADGKTGRIGCTCGWEGTTLEFHEHTGIPPWTDDEIREAIKDGRL